MGTEAGRFRQGTVIAVIAIAIVFVVAGCQWVVPTYSPDGSRHNTAESTISTSNVGSLAAAWTATLGSAGRTLATPVVSSSGTLVTVGEGRLQAFDAAGVAGCSGVPVLCQPL